MRREDFNAQLLAATYLALRFGQKFVIDQLPVDVEYVAILNRSHGNTRSKDVVVFPEDDGKIVPQLTSLEVVDLLHRDNRCPQWIDISVAGVDDEKTLLKLICCGRYHHDERKMYYYKEGSQPFGVKGPDMPPGWKWEDKIELNTPEEALKRILAGSISY